MRGFTILTLLCLMSMSNTTEIKSGDYPDPLCDYPSSCQNCVKQIENVSFNKIIPLAQSAQLIWIPLNPVIAGFPVLNDNVTCNNVQIIVYCVDHIMPTPECVGAIIYASQ